MKLTTGDIQKIFNISSGTINNIIKEGKLTYSSQSPGGHHYFTPEDLLQYRAKYTRRKPATSISFANIKGGVGKTMTCIGTSSTLKLFGHRVLVIDTDPQANLTDYFIDGETLDETQPSVLNIFEKKDTSMVIYKTKFGIDIIPSHLGLANLSKQAEMTSYTSMLKYIESIEKNYDYILLDTSPNKIFPTEAALTASHHAIIVLNPKRWAIKGINMAIEIIDDGNESILKNFKTKILGCVYNMADTRRNVDQNWIELTKAGVHGLKVFENSIPFSIQFEDVITTQAFLYEANIKKSNKNAFYNLTLEIMNEQSKASTERRNVKVS